jgi:hypothetical protein
MKLDAILKASLGRVDEVITDIDITALSVVKNAVNQAYMAVRSTIDRRIKTESVVASNSITLPATCISVTKAKHSADGEYSKSEYYQEGDQLHFYPDVPVGTLSLSYVEAPTLPDDTEDPSTVEIAVKDVYIHALITYGAYAYQLYRRKYTAAQLLFSEYQSIIQPESAKPKN